MKADFWIWERRHFNPTVQQYQCRVLRQETRTIRSRVEAIEYLRHLLRTIDHAHSGSFIAFDATFQNRSEQLTREEVRWQDRAEALREE
jgi:hypothetical protein